MHNQNEPQQNLQDSTQLSPQQAYGGHELLDADEVIGDVVGALEKFMLYEEHIQDQQLAGILQRHREFITQIYNTIADTLKTGQDPAVPTQTYNMEQGNNVIYGMQPAAPKTVSQSTSELSDECISGFILGEHKVISTGLTGAALEATNPVLRRIFADSIPNVIEMAYEVFLYQNKHQYYQVPQLQAQDMQGIQNGYTPIQGNISH